MELAIILFGLVVFFILNLDAIISTFLKILKAAISLFFILGAIFTIFSGYPFVGLILVVIALYYIFNLYNDSSPTTTDLHDISKIMKTTNKTSSKNINKKIDDKVEKNLKNPNKKEKKLDMEVLSFLIKNGLDINAKDINGQTALHKLLKSNLLDDAKELMKNGARLDIKDSDNKTSLELASTATKEYFNPFQLIARDEIELFWKMKENGLDINTKNKNGQTVLHALVTKDLSKDKYKIKKISRRRSRYKQ